MTTLYSVLTALAFFLMPAQTTLYAADLTPLVELPGGYFVAQTSADAPDGYIAVSYDDLSGYVRADAVTEVDYTPVTKYEKTARFHCDNDGQPVNLRAAPKKSATVLTTLPADGVFRCYGSAAGEQLIPGAGTTWYYVNAEGVRGYCYGAHGIADAPPVNIIQKEPEPDRPVSAEPKEENAADDIPRIAVILFIVALCIPVPFIMFYLFKKPKEK